MKKGKGFFGEFKKFIMRGNVMDMAVGVIVGGAFTAIVTSLNQDILTPILGLFGGIDFSYLELTMGSGENAPILKYGNFIMAVINFLITALVIFCIVKTLNAINDRFSRKEGKRSRQRPLQRPVLTVRARSPLTLCGVPTVPHSWKRFRRQWKDKGEPSLGTAASGL